MGKGLMVDVDGSYVLTSYVVFFLFISHGKFKVYFSSAFVSLHLVGVLHSHKRGPGSGHLLLVIW